MDRRVSRTLQLFAVVAAVTAAACSGPLPTDGTAVETRASALSPPPPPMPPPGPQPLGMFVSAPSSMFVSMPGTISVQTFGGPTPTSDVTLTVNLTGSFSLGPTNSWGSSFFICATDTSAPGVATVTCHVDQHAFFAAVDIPLTPTGEGTISVSSNLTAAGVPQASDFRVITVSAADSADLSLGGFADGSAFVGNPAFASFNVFNSGPLTATGVVVTFNLTGPGTFASVGGGGFPSLPICSFTATTATCTADSLPPFGGIFVSVNFTPTGAGDILIAASATANEKDPTPWNNSTITFTNAVQPKYVDLSVAITAGHQTVISKPLDYTVTVRNSGPDTAGGVILYDPLPYGTTFVSATPTQGSCFGGEWGSLNCDLGSLAAGASANVALVVTPTVLAQVTNTPTVYDWMYGDFDVDFSNNQASATVTIHGSTNQLVTGPPTKGGCGLWPGAPIDSLEDGTQTMMLGSKTVGGWFVTSDGTGYQAPSSPDGLVVPGGPAPSKYMVRSSGFGFSNWGAAFGAFFNCPYDVSRFHAVQFDVKGGGGAKQSFFVEVPTIELLDAEFGGRCTSNCSDFYRYLISLPDDSWYRCTVAYTDLRQAGWGMQAPFDVGAVTGAQFNIETWQAPYDLSIDNLKFVAPPKTQTSCVRIAGK